MGLYGCVSNPPPVSEYSLARSALASAKEAGAERLAPGLWYSAEEDYQKGQKAYLEKDHQAAKNSFLQSIQTAEKAENASRLKRFESGETMQ